MYLECAEELDKESVLLPELMDELFCIEDEYERELEHQRILQRINQINSTGLKKQFEDLYKAKAKVVKALLKQETQKPPVPLNNCTEFGTLSKNEQFSCGEWIADDDGVRIRTDKGIAWACPHPIYPTRILKNSETGLYKIELCFKIRGQLRTALVDKDVVASNNKILKLANQSVQVTSLNANWLVQYLSDIESLNADKITESASTSRLGWIDDIDNSAGINEKKFIPYDQTDIVFDNELNTKSLFESVKLCGSRTKWYECVKEIRSKRQPEILINLAASFASVLVEPCGALPFIVSLWGGTGIGKTVVLKLATSVWADPSEGAYITDAKATNTAMEIRLNILNSLPMTLDDMAQVKNQYDDDFSELIYRWCSGKGRDRSNVNLGLNKLTSWRNCTITNGERSLVDESTQGGAVNRVIDIEHTGEGLFNAIDGNRTCNIVDKNYGFAGREFIELIKELGYDRINEIKKKYYDAIIESARNVGVEKEDKQVIPMALILTADELISEYLFKDGIQLNVEQCSTYLKNKGEVSEHKRAYEYIQGTIASNSFHFGECGDSDPENRTECWGNWKDENWLYIVSAVFDRIMKQGNFQSRAFLSWASKQGIIEVDKKNGPKVQHKVNGVNTRCVLIKINEDDGFMDVSEDIQEELPFV